MTIRARSMETDRGAMTWLEAGAGWPVVLLHAFPLSAEMWRPQLDRVPEEWRFIAPDLRGFGRFLPPNKVLPPKGGSYLTVDDYAADVAALMDALEMHDAVIGGLSMGGYVAFAMFRQAPARFAGMVLADTRSQADTPQAREGRLKMRERLARDGPRGVADEMLPKLFSAAAPVETIAAAREMIESAAPAAIDAAIGALMSRPDSTPDLGGMTRGTLVVVGEHDAIIPAGEAEMMQRAIPRSTLAVIPGAGHLSSLERPDAFSRVLADFLRSHI